MKSGLKNDQVGADDSVDESMLLRDSSRPDVAGSMFEPFGIAAPFTGRAQRIVNEKVDSRDQASIVSLPPLVVFPTRLIEDQPHERSSS